MKLSKGFTLIEAIVVIAILAIIAGIAVPMIFTTLERNEAKQTREEMENLQEGILNYYWDMKSFPGGTDVTGLRKLIEDQGGSWNGPYVQGNLIAIQADAWGEDYLYRDASTVDGATVNGKVLISKGMDKNQNSTVGGSNNWTSGGDDIVFPVSSAAIDNEWIKLTKDELAVINAAAVQYFNDNSSTWPGSINDVVPAYAGLPYKTDVWGNDYDWDGFNHDFYSWGPDGIDDSRGNDDIIG